MYLIAYNLISHYSYISYATIRFKDRDCLPGSYLMFYAFSFYNDLEASTEEEEVRSSPEDNGRGRGAGLPHSPRDRDRISGSHNFSIYAISCSVPPDRAR